MNNQILMALKKKLEELSASGNLDAETQRNALKEELQFYVLNFIYHHPKYSAWVMYGGSALRICHGLDRMSVDLDFEVDHEITKDFLDTLKDEIATYFKDTYGAGADILTISITNDRGCTLKFSIGDELSISHPSKQVHVKIDLNHFVAPKTVVERRPINRDQFSFVIKTYNMSALMASKIAAIFLRGSRGVDKVIYEEKGRDIYDLLWYMTKKAMPDLDYLIAKGIDVKDPRALFDKLTLQMNKVSDINLKQDLTPLFVNRTFIENWLKNWRESYMWLLDGYKIYTVTELKGVEIHKDNNTDVFSFVYHYDTTQNKVVSVIYMMTYEWIMYTDLELKASEPIAYPVDFKGYKDWQIKQLRQLVTLFHEKTENYFKKSNKIMLGDSIVTKVIRMTADNLNQKEEILLNKSALLSAELDDLLK